MLRFDNTVMIKNTYIYIYLYLYLYMGPPFMELKKRSTLVYLQDH